MLFTIMLLMFDLVFRVPHWKESQHYKEACPCLLFEPCIYILLCCLNCFFLVFSYFHSLNSAWQKNQHSVLKVLPAMVIFKLIAYLNGEYVVLCIFYGNSSLSRVCTPPV